MLFIDFPDEIISQLNSPEVNERKKAVIKIGEMKLKEAVPDLIQPCNPT